MPSYFFQHKTKGFTLIETLLVLGVVGILLAIIVVVLSNAGDRGRDTVRKSDISSIDRALRFYLNSNLSFAAITGTPASGCTNGAGDGVLVTIGGTDVCEALYYSNSAPAGVGNHAWADLQIHLAQYFPGGLPVDPFNNYDDWANYPASTSVCSSGCDDNSPLSDGYYLVRLTSSSVSDSICSDTVSRAYFVHGALEGLGDPDSLLNQGYSCFNTGNLPHLISTWGS